MLQLDSNNNIVQKNLDGGDTAQRTGFVETALKLRERLGISNDDFNTSTPWRFQNQWPTLFIDKKLIRNPRPGDRWNDPTDTSRDQSLSMISAFALNGMWEQMKWVEPKGFFSLFPNKDLTDPCTRGFINRLSGKKPTWLQDFWGAQSIAVRIRVAQSKGLDDVGDDLNCLLVASVNIHLFPTETSRAALKRYFVERPVNFGTVKLGEKCPVMGALKWYCRPESGGNDEVAEVWRPLVDFYRSVLGCPITK